MKKRLKMIILCVFIIIIFIISFKGINLYLYNIEIYSDDAQQYNEGLQITKTIVIEKSSISNSEKINFKNINLKNSFQNFELSAKNDKALEYVLRDENGNKKQIFTLVINDTYVNTIKNGDLSFASGTLQNLNRSKILKENSIDNDIELIKKIVETKDVKNNFFDSISRMKEVFFFQDVALEMFPILENIKLIEGEFTGYIFKVNEAMTVINILKKDKRYTFQFFGFEITEQYIYEFLNDLEIN